jgi:hypothetical protein
MQHWHVRPTEGSRWEIETPDGELIPCALGSIAIELGTKLAREGKGCVIIWNSDGRISCGEDFTGPASMLWSVQ